MLNLFFDLLPSEIREEIYGIRLSDSLTRNYYRRVRMKVALAKFVLKLQNQNAGFNYHIGYSSYNPNSNIVRYITEKCSEVITNSDDRIWWISQLIRPIERGLIIQENLSELVSENYIRTEYACDRMIEILKCRRNPNRTSSLS
jgi:hypothetical protein